MSPSVNDWAAKCAARIDSEYPHARRADRPSVDRVAAIIATFAAPLLSLLNEARREHEHHPGVVCCPQCTCDSWPHEDDDAADEERELVANSDASCTCGADAWNARIDAALAGR